MKNIKKLLPYLINSLIVILIFCFILFISKTYPFGRYLALGKSDAIYQYKPMLYNFIMSIKTHTLTQFSFNNGLGNSFFFNFAYYLTSPLNLVALLFKTPDAMFLSVILIKIFITAVICTFYAKSKGVSNLVSFIVTISYVFCSWFVVYYYNIMWLDTFMMFPLFQYGLEKLINKKNSFIFIIALAYIYATNFLLAFSVLVYGLVFFVIKNFFYDQKKIKEKLKTGVLFIISFIFSILIIAFYFHMLIVVKRQMGLSFSNSNDSGYILTTVNFIKSLFYGNNILDINFTGYTFPNIAVNTFIFLNVIYYFLNSKIKLRDKAFVFIGLTLIIDCLFSTKLDYVMNFFHNVVGLTYRYVFIFSFLAIILFIKNVQNYDKKDFKKMIPVILLMIVIALLLYKHMALKIVIFNIISLLMYLLIIIFYQDKNIFKYLICSIIIIQSILVGLWTMPSNIEKSFERIEGEYQTESQKYRLITLGEGDYRNKNLYTNEDVTHSFTSMTYNNVLNMVNKLGYSAGGNGMAGNIYNDLFALIFNVKKNNRYLEKIYAVNNDIKDLILNDDIKRNTEELVDKLSNIEDIYNEIKLEPNREDEENYYFNIDYKYFFIKDEIRNEIYPLGSTEVKLKKSSNKSSITIYTLNEDKLDEIYNKLSQNQINYTYYNDNKIEGKIAVLEDQIIFTSIPYDENWQITVDGKNVKPVKLLDSLIGIKVNPGEHQIKMIYKCDFKKSIIISFISIILLISLIILQKHNKNY